MIKSYLDFIEPVFDAAVMTMFTTLAILLSIAMLAGIGLIIVNVLIPCLRALKNNPRHG